MKRYLVVALLGLIISTGVSAKDKPVEIDGKHILVTDFSVGLFGDNHPKPIAHSNDFGNGLYVMIGGVNSRLLNAERIVTERFKLKGFKIADTLEGSSAAFTFTSNLALDMVRADKQAANSALPNSQQLTSGAGNLANAIITGMNSGGGAAGLAGFVIGQLFQTDTKLVISGSIYKKPYIGKRLSFGSPGIMSGEKDGEDFGVAKVFYRLEKDKEATQDIVLKMAVDEWIDHYIAIDSPIEAPLPAASAVAAATTLADQH